MSILLNHHMTRMAQALCAVLLTVSASYAADVDLSTLTDSYTAQDGDVLSGTLGGNYQISIADGATVTLDGVTIDGGDDVAQNDVYSWAGLTCLGDCTIKLADKSKNTVKGFYEYYPGIYVPESKTMTIEGTGSLDASSNGYGAGIGGGNGIPCGNIVIKGGSITATGSGNAAGIGSGAGAQAGNITITDGVTNVTAKPGEWAPNSVGAGNGGSVGSITIGGVVSGNVTTNPFKYPVTGTYTVVFDVNGGSGAMENQTIRLGFPQVLSKNAFTRKGYRFTGWNTEPDGSGIGYEDLAKVENLAEKDGSITLYALWFQGDIKDLKNNYTIKDGETVKGTLGGNYKISIADGATVTLDGVTINGVDNETAKWAGLTCLGECKIVLAEGSINTVKGFYLGFPGIYVPEGKTLTIEGTGSLEASSNGSGAGIGGGGNLSCGNIVIKGGEIKAEGGYGSAGIGSGYGGTAGAITITDGVTKVTATAGSDAPNSVGAGTDGSAGVVTVAGVETGNIDVNTFEFEPSIINYIVDKNNNIIASINGYDDHTKEFPDIGDTTVAGVIFNRNLATAGYSTIVLPFKVKTENLTGVKSVSTFGGVEPGKVTPKAVRMDVVWKDDGRENVELDAYTPYLIETDGSFKVNGAVTIETIENQKDTTTVDNWSFVGARSFKKWEDGDSELGHAYGFAASSSGDVKAGDFVKLGAGAYIYPMRAYLVKEMEVSPAPPMPSDYSAVAQRAQQASLDEELPDRMSVVIVDRNENGEEETTVIGSFDTRTGEFQFTMPVRNYDLKGRRLQGKPKARGAYYGKKVLAK